MVALAWIVSLLRFRSFGALRQYIPAWRTLTKSFSWNRYIILTNTLLLGYGTKIWIEKSFKSVIPTFPVGTVKNTLSNTHYIPTLFGKFQQVPTTTVVKRQKSVIKSETYTSPNKNEKIKSFWNKPSPSLALIVTTTTRLPTSRKTLFFLKHSNDTTSQIKLYRQAIRVENRLQFTKKI